MTRWLLLALVLVPDTVLAYGGFQNWGVYLVKGTSGVWTTYDNTEYTGTMIVQPDGVVDRRQDIDETVVITEDTLIAYLLGEAEREGLELLDDVDAVNVVEAHLRYFEAIGAVGPEAGLDDVL